MASEPANEYAHNYDPCSHDDWSLIMGAPMSQLPLTIPHPMGEGVGYNAGSTAPGGSEVDPFGAFAAPSATNRAAEWQESFESLARFLRMIIPNFRVGCCPG
ncbi:hypothetical protein IFM47457_05532 [Aspergillus lentulus]|nr:hypothetical protein IFM47457_05532 [Aspergillus lentulus]